MEIRNLTPHTGVEVLGLDLREGADPDTKAKLQRLLANHAVVVFRGPKLAPPQFIQAASIFGEIMPQMLERFTLPEHPLVGFVSSEDTDKPGGKRIVRGEQYHTDHSNYPAPPKATLLHAVTLPSKGGDTQFVNVHASYAELPEEMKRKIDGLRVLHVYLSSRSPRKKAVLTQEEKQRIPETWQPLVPRHPENGRKGLYLNTAHMERIEGMADAEAFELIGELMAHATQPKYEYRHKWRDGDMVIWDNRSVMHQANGDYTEQRYLLRLMIKGVPLTR
jgi:alpha-ketoglutarate-dependent taurine dioxygenase